MVRETETPGMAGAVDRVAELERTVDALRQESEVAHVLLGLSAALAEVKTSEQTLERALTTSRELLGANRAFAVTYDRATHTFTVLATSGMSQDGAATLEAYARKSDGLPVMRQSLMERRPILVDDAANDPQFTPAEARRRRLRGYIAIPVIRSGVEFAGLGVEFDSPQSFGFRQSALARSIGQSVGVALANARRFSLLEKLRVFGLDVGARLRIDRVLPSVVAGALELVEGDGAALYFYDSERRDLAMVVHEGSGIPHDAVTRIGLADDLEALVEGEPVWIEDLASVAGATLESGQSWRAVFAPIPRPGGSLLAAVGVFFLQDRVLSADEMEALSVLAAQSAIAIANAQRYEQQRAVARNLQEGLLTTDVPNLDEWDIGAVYEAAGGEVDVGGDFYDVFDFADARFGIAVGDVSGKGAEAAAQTAVAKYTLRAFAMRDPSPSSVLYHLNNALERAFGEDRFATAVYGVFDPDARQAVVAVAGHPPPVVYRHDNAGAEVLSPDGTLLGVFAEQQYQAQTVDLGPNDVFVAYTDGLMEVRADGDTYGPDRIARSLERHVHGNGAQEIARKMYEDAESFGSVEDDTVVVVVRCRSDR